MSLFSSVLNFLKPASGEESTPPGALPEKNTFEGSSTSDENSFLNELNTELMVHHGLVEDIRALRSMYRDDPRMTKITNRTARSMVKGGLQISTSANNKLLIKKFNEYMRRCGLKNRQALESYGRGFFLEGNLPLQWVIDTSNPSAPRVVRAIRMPTETIRPNVLKNGQIADVNEAYIQRNAITGEVLAKFPLWQMSLARLCPSNYDDMSAMGTPYMSSARAIWKKLARTEKDLVVRRASRAPQRMAHSMPGMNRDDLTKYKNENRRNQSHGNNSDYYFNVDGAVKPIEGDANLDQIADVTYLLDTFFSGSPGDKAIFGYASGVNRDILEELRRDYHEELDSMQDTLAQAFDHGFRLDLLLQGINPDNFTYDLVFAERNSESLNQKADRALKLKALGASSTTVFEAAGLDPDKELKNRKHEMDSGDPYPSQDVDLDNPQNITVVEGNGRNGESQTAVSNA